MAQRRRSPHVGIALLVLTALAFTLTACAYTVLTFQSLGAAPAAGDLQVDSRLFEFLDRHGAGLLGAELVALALAAVAAVALDRRRTGRQGSAISPPTQHPESHESGVP